MIGHARTGSNFLYAGVATSKKIKMYGEIFSGRNREVGTDFERIYSTLMSKPPPAIERVGFKLFYYHFTDAEWDTFIERKDFAVVHLTRRNYLRTIVSLDIASKTQKWVARDITSPVKTHCITLDSGKIVARIEAIQRLEAQARERMRGWKLLEITYEELVGNPAREFGKIASFLSVNDINCKGISLVKQNPGPLRELIKNYNEISAILHQTRFSKLLER